PVRAPRVVGPPARQGAGRPRRRPGPPARQPAREERDGHDFLDLWKGASATAGNGTPLGRAVGNAIERSARARRNVVELSAGARAPPTALPRRATSPARSPPRATAHRLG